VQQLPLLEEEVSFEAARPRVLVLACGAIAREVLALVRVNGWDHVELRCLPAKLHSTPREIPAAVDRKLREVAGRYESVFVGYADCGTAGALDHVLAEHGVERIPGAHCYGFLAGNDAWDALQEDEPGTYYLTDFLARHFDALVWRPLGLDRHPELLEPIFGNYTRLVYLAQTDDPALEARARDAAARLGLRYERVQTGLGELATTLEAFVAERAA
jgi:hypothetical protein